MYRPRIIPILLVKGGGLVKSVRFSRHRYIGDPINAVRIFNELKADELSIFDIMAIHENRSISTDLVKKVGEEATMPFSVGGGINSLNQIQNIIKAGAEKVILNTIAVEEPSFVNQAAKEFGSSTIAVCIDVKKDYWGKIKVYSRGGTNKSTFSPLEFAMRMEQAGAGEIVLQSIDRDGTMLGYDISLVREISSHLTIPIVALGGAGSLLHMKELLQAAQINGLAAGSLFIYHGERKAVLINYPSHSELVNIME